ncbi:flagellar basal-body MS-ring/collar protein FliF [Ureibacillus terrenus]|uniref:Flagellar M-ring protein n=1 Tax=Ureibacillus terrenus TaxID=118246 RepID=A0A540V4E0_9BACL|nr:flagellar basal-body MS-ring/collar protein FliF [Ureibacillus terrenus]MED3660395.1 flagellar basal-body MS-ring/collar protein FliF [Ureibacillus terrenus]MED3762551.1 flagellar basal-body MS-ring/collar protein FliF [Ureibacillus terrenus]TQE91615.1 flagellar basal body M-ring protein FliF [Ureibacillus terrenus]
MNDRLKKIKTDTIHFWKSRTKKQKGALIGTLAGVVVIASLITYITTRTEMVPLFTELSAKEAGEIAEILSSQGITYEIAPGGTNILVPEDQVDNIKVSLAAQGYPESGEISTTFFTENAGFGMTDNEFNVIKHEALETELENLIKKIDGIKDAKVMISMPEKGVFIHSDTENEEASAAVIIHTEPGYKFSEEQIRTLYNLVSKSVPNLSPENITISNQYSEYYDLEPDSSNGSIDSVEGQMNVKKTIEKDLERQVHKMLGTLMGQDKVVVSVTTDIDFKKENREEKLVEPVDKENMEGIEISAQRITETYSGMDGAAGPTEMGDPTDNATGYQEVTNGDGDYERIEETVNNEVNRINRTIQESPYKIRDIGIQVMVEPPVPEDPTSLSDTVVDDIEKILATVVRTSIDKEAAGELTDEDIENKIVVSVQPFYGNDVKNSEEFPTIPWWIWVVGGILVAAIILLVVYIIRSRKHHEEEYEIIEEQEKIHVDDINQEKETESTIRRKQLEKMAKERPEEFAKLLRSWIAED